MPRFPLESVNKLLDEVWLKWLDRLRAWGGRQQTGKAESAAPMDSVGADPGRSVAVAQLSEDGRVLQGGGVLGDRLVLGQ